MTRLGRLRRRLGSALKSGYILGGLKDAIEQDPDFRLSVSMEPIDEEAFDRAGRHPTTGEEDIPGRHSLHTVRKRLERMVLQRRLATY
jgi:hypothetical protein